MKKREPRATILGVFGELSRERRKALERIPGTAHSSADAAACLLGMDLWRGPLLLFRRSLEVTGERPHLWTFAFARSSAWEASRWNRLPFAARLVRARVGYLDRVVRASPTAWSLSVSAATFREGLDSLRNTGFAVGCRGGALEFAALAPPEALSTDLALIEVVAHWLWRLADRDRVLADPHASGFEVHGYAGCCASCRSRWGLRERDERWVPPFHPGCRCFAQPRFLRYHAVS